MTGGGPGQKTFDPNRSEVLRLLQEDERPLPRGHALRPSPGRHDQPHHQSARYEGQQADHEMHYHGYVDHNKQSPAMHALENQMAEGDGTSDF